MNSFKNQIPRLIVYIIYHIRYSVVGYDRFFSIFLVWLLLFWTDKASRFGHQGIKLTSKYIPQMAVVLLGI